MPIITGLIEDSAGIVIPLGRLTVQLRQPIIDRSTTPDAVLTTLPRSWTITNGVINSPAQPGSTLGQVNLPATEAELVSYRFTVEQSISTTTWYLNDGTEYPDDAPRVQNSGIWYTGATFVVGESKQITPVVRSTFVSILDPFDAILPNVGTLEFVDLIDLAADFVSQPQAGLVYLGRLLTTTPEFVDKLKLGSFRGTYSAGATYQRGDVVTFGSPDPVCWISRSASPITGSAPPSSGTTGNANWDFFPAVSLGTGGGSGALYVLKSGDTMSGNLVLPPPGASPPNTIALRRAEADNLYLPTANDANYVKLTGAQTVAGVKTFSSSPVVPTGAAGNNSTNAANNAFVQQEIASLFAPRLLVSANMDGTPPAIATGVTNLIFETELYDPTNRYNNATGDFTVPANGTYEFECRLLVRAQGSISSAGDVRMVLRLYLFNFTASGEVGNFALLNLPMSSQLLTYQLHGRLEARDLTANQILIPRISIAVGGTGGGTLSNLSIDTAQGTAQNNLRAYRVTF